MYGARLWLVLVAAAALATALPAAAAAHGAGQTVASSYLARVGTVPAGLRAKVVDGDQRMWLRAPARETVIVLDVRGAPYLRFDRAGVQVNRNSAMYYLNQTPVAAIPPPGLTRSTAPRWVALTGSHDYVWHDGRLHALAAVALAPGARYVGRWSVPLLVDGRAERITGALWHADRPSIVWFWPIVVLLACVAAALRLRRPLLDARLARALAAAALAALAIGGVGLELHGRPNVSGTQLVELVLILAFVGWGLARLSLNRAGWFAHLVIAAGSLWAGLTLFATLRDGFVLTALPAFLARAVTVLCLGCGAALLPLVFRLAEAHSARSRSVARTAATAVVISLLGGCGSSSHSAELADGGGIPAALLRQARPIGVGPRFRPPAAGPVPGRCRPALGRAVAVHVELFAADRVVIVPAGIGTRPPRTVQAGRITRARCYGDLVTLEPTGIVLIRTGHAVTLAELFRAWGQPLSSRRLGPFAAPGGVSVYVGGRAWSGPPGAVPLTPHAEIVLEVGPHVPPHRSFTFPPGL